MATTTRNEALGNAKQGTLVGTIVAILNDVSALVNELRTTVTTLQGASVNSILSNPGLRIDGGSGAAIAEAENAYYVIANGTLVTDAAGTNMPALAGTVDNGDFGIYLWSIEDDGTINQATLTTAGTLAALAWPTVPADQAVIGAVLINPTGTGDFVGGTTDLDDGTVTPNAVFFNGNDMAGAFNPAAAALTESAVDDIAYRYSTTPTS